MKSPKHSGCAAPVLPCGCCTGGHRCQPHQASHEAAIAADRADRAEKEG